MLGAARALGDPYNWYQAGDLTPEEASESFRVIVQDAPYNQRTCPNPAGGKIFRVNASGKTQELGDAGDWQDPSGDATIPPVPAREGSDPDIKCLAAKNAANVLQLLYENLTDSFNSHLDEAEAATALTLTTVALLGSEFAPITFALVTFFSIVFSVLYGVLEFVAADLWDENFTKQLVCILLDCATASDGVVTFDWDCFQSELSAQTNVFDLTFEQLRLFGQIQYLLLVIGGVDALNTAGATAAITDDNCDECDTGWCKTWNATNGWEGWYAADGNSTLSGGTWHNVGGVNSIRLDLPTSCTVNAMLMTGGANQVAAGGARTIYEIDPTVTLLYSGDTGAGVIVYNLSGSFVDFGTIQFNLDSTVGGYSSEIQEITLSGTGTPPEGVDCA